MIGLLHFVDYFRLRAFQIQQLLFCRSFGLGYLYRGLDAKLIQSFITAGFMFLAYEKISKLLLSLLLPQNKKILKSKMS